MRAGPRSIPDVGALAERQWEPRVLRLTSLAEPRTVTCGDASVTVSTDPLTVRIEAEAGRLVQLLRIDEKTGALELPSGRRPGTRTRRRRAAVRPARVGRPDAERSRRLSAQDPRWARSDPLADRDQRLGHVRPSVRPVRSTCPAAEGRFIPAGLESSLAAGHLRRDRSRAPRIMAEYARLTGLPEMPPLWSFGYQQSHRTLAGREEVLSIARTFREKRLPCDALIYLGTGFCPSGWNTGHGSFTFNPKAFPDPKGMIDELHALHFHVVPHVVIRSRSVRGSGQRPASPNRTIEEDAAATGPRIARCSPSASTAGGPTRETRSIAASRLTRIRMYWEGPQLDRPERPPLRASPQRLRRHAALRRLPLVGRRLLDLGDPADPRPDRDQHGPDRHPLLGYRHRRLRADEGAHRRALRPLVPVRRLLPALPLARPHLEAPAPPGAGTPAISARTRSATYGDAANPDPAELHNAAVEPICRKYLELRYQLLPYLYSVVHESHDTGLPIMRALWLHYPDDPAAVARGDEYLWGRDILVAPVTEKGATSRTALPPARGLVRLLDRGAHRGRRAKSTGPSTCRHSRSTCGPAPSFRWARSSSTPTSNSTAR